MPRKIITNEIKDEIIEFYLSYPMTLKTVSERFDICIPTVIKILKNTPKYKKTIIYNPGVNERYFEIIDSDEKAYFLGLLIADGNVFIPKKDGRSASISLTLDMNDSYMLSNFNNALGLNHTIWSDSRGCGQVAIRSNIMAEDLSKFGIIPNKTLHTYLPNINSMFYSGLIRGILDGDGCIQCHMNVKTNKHYHNISFCGTHKLMEDISNLLNNALHLKIRPKVYDYKNRNLSEIKIQNIEDIIKVGNWVYANAQLFLKRKYDKYCQLLKYYESAHVNTEVTK